MLAGSARAPFVTAKRIATIQAVPPFLSIFHQPQNRVGVDQLIADPHREKGKKALCVPHDKISKAHPGAMCREYAYVATLFHNGPCSKSGLGQGWAKFSLDLMCDAGEFVFIRLRQNTLQLAAGSFISIYKGDSEKERYAFSGEKCAQAREKAGLRHKFCFLKPLVIVNNFWDNN